MARHMFTFPPYMYYDEEPELDWRIPGTMQRSNTLSTLMHGVRFIHGMQSPPKSPDEEVKMISTLPSVLDLSNRRALARQGFYGNEYVFPKPKSGAQDDASNGSRITSLSAAEKRQKFHASVRSTRSKNWSFTTEEEEVEEQKPTDQSNVSDRSSGSSDNGLVLRSFSERFSSDSSLESYDSYEETNRRRMVKQNSISNLRKQYQDTIRRSMDGTNDVPVFDTGPDVDDDDDDDSCYGDKGSISRMREKQVENLMSHVIDDGDYCHNLRPDHPKLSNKLDSTQSTLVGTPKTPSDINFSFDNSLQDGQSEFDFSSPPSPTEENPNPGVSIVIDTDINDNNAKCDDVDMKPCCSHPTNSNSNELSTLSLVLRSDSCHTLVPQDSEGLDGDLTPRGGDVSPGLVMMAPDYHHLSNDTSSESTGSCATLNTVLPADPDERYDRDYIDHDSLGFSNGAGNSGKVGMDQLKPSICQPQESFELEEISSADNGVEDVNGNSCKYSSSRGHMEKSFSTQSDSSGFADVDPSGEINVIVQDLQKEHSVSQLRSRPSLLKQKTLQPGSHDHVSSYHDNQRPPVTRVQSENVQLFKSEDNQSYYSRPVFTDTSIPADGNICFCEKRIPDTDSEIVKPTLASISYCGTQQEQHLDKGLMFTVDVPLETSAANKSHDRSHDQPRYVSSLKLNVCSSNDSLNSSAIGSHSNSVTFKQQGATKYTKISGLARPGNSFRTVTKGGKFQDSKSSVDLRSRNIDLTASKSNSFDETTRVSNAMFESDVLKMSAGELKSNVLQKQRAKAALVAANNQTADWLLGSQTLGNSHTGDGNSCIVEFKVGRPSWASTPNLKNKSHTAANTRDHIHYGRRSNKPETSLSLDLLDDDNDDPSERPFLHHGNMMFREGEIGPHEGYAETATYQTFQPSVHIDSNYESSDESVSLHPASLHSSATSVPEDFLHFQKLVSLVNGPSMFLKSSDKMPTARFTPNLRMKDWTQPSKHKQLEEEARLMQYAVRRYKDELFNMEAVLLKMYEQAQCELVSDELADVEEVRHLWREVSREVGKMEDLLTDRLVSVETGNISYSPLDSLHVVQGMINLLREQLYHQQMCLTREVNMPDDDLDDILSACPSAHSTSSVSDAVLSDISNQVVEMRQTLEQSQQFQKQEMDKSLTQFRESLLEEVKGQISSTKNSEMLQLQLQARENEIRRLKMALQSQNKSPVRTKTFQTIESDV